MTKLNKIILSIPSILTLSYILTFWFPTKFIWLVPNMKVYYIQLTILQILTIIQFAILIRKLWKLKNIEKSKKREWTLFLIFFNSFASLIFIWFRIDKLKELNENNLTNKTIASELV